MQGSFESILIKSSTEILPLSPDFDANQNNCQV